MSKTILFSPVGMTDPIRYFRDGAMLNIIRHYQPDTVYLYMSKEIVIHHRADNRYLYTIEKLTELLGKKIDVHVIERPELEDVQLFDSFINEFTVLLSGIHRENPDSRIILNVSSGTPAMKSSLQILSLTMNFPTLPVQVSTPQKQSNPRIDDEKNASPEELWELNESNSGDDNRCIVSTTENLLTQFKKQSIIKLIGSYDYAAACELAQGMDIFPKPFIEMLDGANSRLKLDYGKTAKNFEKYGHNIRLSNNKEFEELAEYIQLLIIKVKKQEYADFARAITPAIARLFELYLKNKCSVDISAYTALKNNVRCWDMNKLQGTDLLNHLNAGYKEGFKGDFVKSDNLCELILCLSADPDAKKCARELRDKIEKGIRNVAAHSVITVTEAVIKQSTGFSSDEILDRLISMLGFCGMSVSGNFRRAYSLMNEIMISSLN